MRRAYQKTFNPFEETKLIIEDSLSNVNTIMPCEVVSSEYPTVTIKPLIKRTFYNDIGEAEFIPYGEINKIPVLTLGNQEFNISFPPPSAGDIGLFLVCQNQITQVYETIEEKNSVRKFDLLDGIYIPLFLNSNTSESDKITVNTSKFNVSNGDNELIASLVACLGQIKSLTTTDGASVSPGSQAAIQAEIDKIQSFL
jgi:hypothetical protein